jgi:hypothetical protein
MTLIYFTYDRHRPGARHSAIRATHFSNTAASKIGSPGRAAARRVMTDEENLFGEVPS